MADNQGVNRVWTGVWVVALAALGAVFAWFATTDRDAQALGGTPTEALEPEIKKEAPEVARFPGNGYELAQVRAGESVEIFDRPGGDSVGRLGPRTEFDSPRVFPVLEPGKRWLSVAAPEFGNGVPGWVRYDPDKLALGDTQISLFVELSDRTMELRHGEEVIREATVSIGRAGAETPVGRFAVTDRIVRGLDPVYGAGAIALSARQPNLPEDWPGGDRIAIHGWAGPVGDAASGGCLRANDEDIEALIERLPLGAPVFIEN